MNADSPSGSSIQIFENSQFGRIRTSLSDNGEPLFCLMDVCEALGLSNPRKVKTQLNPKGVTISDTLTNGGIQQLNFINEPNLYKCIFKSRKKEAELFQDWVCSVVLPAIRKTGSYSVAQSTPSVPAVPQSFSEALMLAARQAEQLEQQQKQIEQLSRQQEQQRARIEADKKQMDALSAKAILADRAFAAEGSFLTISQAAKVLRLPYGATTLFRTLREKGVLFARSNEPRQEYIKKGYFVLVQKLVPRNSHPDLLVTQTLVTQAGLVFISRLLNL